MSEQLGRPMLTEKGWAVTLTIFDWCRHERHAECHREGTTANGVLRCSCWCHRKSDAA